MGAKLEYRPVKGILDALRVRTIRNTCYKHLTNNPHPIGILAQIRWYYTQYRKLEQSSEYRLFLFFDPQGIAIAYGALKLQDDRLFITECVREGYRGQGYGKLVLQSLMDTATREGRALVAEIWADNHASIAMHERAGFELISSHIKSGREVKTYILS